MMTVIDYGCGNTEAFCNVYRKLNIPVKVARTPPDLDGVSHLILPGVGSFDFVMNSFNASGLRARVQELVQAHHIPVLGVCAGMQILADGSEEGVTPGLGWIPGYVRRFDDASIPYVTKCPHMGWNNITHSGDRLFDGIATDQRFYFVHSYFFEPVNPATSIANCSYGTVFSAAVARNCVFGVQFHPEKSHSSGTRLLLNFSNL